MLCSNQLWHVDRVPFYDLIKKIICFLSNMWYVTQKRTTVTGNKFFFISVFFNGRMSWSWLYKTHNKLLCLDKWVTDVCPGTSWKEQESWHIKKNVFRENGILEYWRWWTSILWAIAQVIKKMWNLSQVSVWNNLFLCRIQEKITLANGAIMSELDHS